MEPQKNEESRFMKVAGVARYVIGIGLLAFIFFGVPALAHQSPFLVLMMTVSLPGAVIFDPLIIIAVYLMFTKKFNWRIDVTALLIAIACLVILYQLATIPQGQQGSAPPADAGQGAAKTQN